MHTNTTAVSSSLKVQVIAAGLLVAFGATGNASASSGSSKTAQGVFVKLVTPTELAIEQNIQYRFDRSIAAGYFTNAWDGQSATATCSPQTACAGTPPPPPPPVPAPLVGKVQDIIDDNRCVWMNGGTVAGNTYQQSVSVSVGKANYKYIYSYLVTASPDSVAPKTAWVYDRTLGGSASADLDVNAQIAGESVVVSNQFPAPGKFSFSLNNSDGTSRVANLVYTITNQNDPNDAVQLPVLSSTSYPTDLKIESYNGGTNGNAGLLWSALPAMMSTILNNDAARNNDNGGADGSAMAVETVQPATFTLPPGDYLINLSGTVKGNATSASMNFNIQNKTKITYVGSRCGQ